jgi:hypothetical protein
MMVRRRNKVKKREKFKEGRLSRVPVNYRKRKKMRANPVRWREEKKVRSLKIMQIVFHEKKRRRKRERERNFCIPQLFITFNNTSHATLFLKSFSLSISLFIPQGLGMSCLFLLK